MTLQQAISKIHAPKGLTSILSGLMSNDYSVIPHQKGKNADFQKAKDELQKQQTALKNCNSDWAYWSILGDVAYWEAIVHIYEAAEITGPDSLPDIDAPNMEGLVVMDCIGKVQEFGMNVLNAAKRTVPQ